MASLFGGAAKCQDFRTGRRSGNGRGGQPRRHRRRTDRSLFSILLRAPHRAEHDDGDEQNRIRPSLRRSRVSLRSGGAVMYHRGVERSAVGATFTLVRDPFERRWRSVLTPRRSRQGGKPPCR